MYSSFTQRTKPIKFLTPLLGVFKLFFQWKKSFVYYTIYEGFRHEGESGYKAGSFSLNFLTLVRLYFELKMKFGVVKVPFVHCSNHLILIQMQWHNQSLVAKCIYLFCILSYISFNLDIWTSSDRQIHSLWGNVNIWIITWNFPNLLLLEDDPVKEELQSFIGVVDAQLLKTVHL